MQSTATGTVTGLLYRKYTVLKGPHTQSVELEAAVLDGDVACAQSRLDDEINVVFHVHGKVIEEKAYTPWPDSVRTGVEYVVFEPVAKCPKEQRLLWRCTGVPAGCAGAASDLLHREIREQYPRSRHIGDGGRRAADRYPFRSDKDIPYPAEQGEQA